jgi:hypothetical protein
MLARPILDIAPVPLTRPIVADRIADRVDARGWPLALRLDGLTLK